MLGKLAFAVLGAAALFAYLIWFTASTFTEAIIGAVIFLIVGLLIALFSGRSRGRRDP